MRSDAHPGYDFYLFFGNHNTACLPLPLDAFPTGSFLKTVKAHPELATRQVQAQLAVDLIKISVEENNMDKADEYNAAVTGFAQHPNRAAWFVKQQRKTTAASHDDIHSMCSGIQKMFNDKFLQRSHIGVEGPESIDFEYCFVCSSGDSRSDACDRVEFNQMELILECLEGGRLFPSGIHLDGTFQRMRGWVMIGMHTLDPHLMRAVDL